MKEDEGMGHVARMGRLEIHTII